MITELIAIPLGSSYAKSKLEQQMYFLFFGPSGSGKTLMVRALAYECNAMIMDISPENLINRYTEKSATNKMLYMVFTCAKEFQPAIIYIDEVE